MRVLRSSLWTWMWLLTVALIASRASAQLDLNGLAGDGGEKPKPPYVVTAQFSQGQDGQPPRLFITTKLSPGWHVYSITQPPGGPIRTVIKVNDSDQYRLAGDFAAYPEPDKKNEKAFEGLLVESHHDEVTWYAPLQLAHGVDPTTLSIAGKITLQACNASNCLPPTAVPFEAKLGPGVDVSGKPAPPPASKVGVFQQRDSHVTILGQIEPKVVAPGGTAKLVLTARPDAGYHVYALSQRESSEGSKPTLIVLEATSQLTAGAPKPNREPHDGQHDEPVRWTITLTVPPDAKPGPHPISGLIGYQTCRATQCDFPAAASFTGQVIVGESTSDGSTPLAFEPAVYGDVAALLPTGDEANDDLAANAVAPAPASLPLVLLMSLAGGLILNLMPCVLPVIGLKILSFVQQSGHSRTHVLMLNLWYSAGIMVVFMALATLAVTLNLSWGEQFQSATFNIVMAGLVFVMALSFLGVWEIPIPGFVGTGKANELAAHEGAIGAFVKGALSTVLATPCSGPLLGAVFGFTLKQPPYVTYAIFATIGLGMASPYLLIGAFPHLIRFLPKPGAWMDTFKQIMGFVMLGTIAVLMKFFIKNDLVVPTFGLLIGLWVGCWWVGRTPLYENLGKRVKAWTGGAVLAATAGGLAFFLLLPRPAIIEWHAFSKPALEQYTAQGRTVLVDFTADWCLTCQVNYANAIDTEGVRQLVEKNNVVPMLADWTDGSDEIKQMLNGLGSNSIPLVAIYPAGKAGAPIVLRDLLTEGQVIEALETAGPSHSGQETIAAMSP